MINIESISTSEEIIFIISILINSDIDNNPNGSNGLYVILLPSRPVLIGLILNFFSCANIF